MILVSTATTGQKDVMKALDFLKKININNIELGAFHDPVKDLEKVIQFRKDNNTRFTVHSFFPPIAPSLMLNYGSSDPRLLKKYVNFAKNSIEFCRKIDALLYSMHSGYDSEVDSQARPISEVIAKEAMFENTKRSITEIADYAANYGLRVAVENHSSQDREMYFSRPDELLKLINEIKAKNLGLLIDIGHLNIASKKLNFSMEEAISKMKDHIFQFHIHSNDGSKDQHLPLTDNNLVSNIPKELSKKCLFVLEGKRWSKEQIFRSKEILESVLL